MLTRSRLRGPARGRNLEESSHRPNRMTSTGRPLGSNLPVIAPDGFAKVIWTQLPVEDRPGSAQSPSSTKCPSSSTWTVSTMTDFVFVLYTRTWTCQSIVSTRRGRSCSTLAYLSLSWLDLDQTLIDSKGTNSRSDVSAVAGHVEFGSSDRDLNERIIYIYFRAFRWRNDCDFGCCRSRTPDSVQLFGIRVVRSHHPSDDSRPIVNAGWQILSMEVEAFGCTGSHPDGRKCPASFGHAGRCCERCDESRHDWQRKW
jgi:hypothetical protein